MQPTFFYSKVSHLVQLHFFSSINFINRNYTIAYHYRKKIPISDFKSKRRKYPNNILYCYHFYVIISFKLFYTYNLRRHTFNHEILKRTNVIIIPYHRLCHRKAFQVDWNNPWFWYTIEKAKNYYRLRNRDYT